MSLPSRSNIVIAILALCVIILIAFKGCGTEPIKPIEPLKAKNDSIHERVVYKDRWRTEVVVKYRTLKGRIDTIPCPDALNQAIILTDSIIMVDSSLISSLKAEILIDNLIISQDSIKIISLTKDVKKQKRRKKLWQSIAVALGVIAAVK